MGAEDMRAVGRIRGILGKHFLELNDLHISCTRGVVRVLGTVKRLNAIEGLSEIMPITEKFIHDIKMEIKRLPNIKRVIFVQDDEGS